MRRIGAKAGIVGSAGALARCAPALAALSFGGCVPGALPAGRAPTGGAPEAVRSDAVSQMTLDGRVTLAELEQMTHAFSDRYTTLLTAACDALEQGNASLDERRMAHRFKLISITSIYDIATNPDPFTQLIDMLLVVTLESQVWIDEGRADDLFGARAQALVGPLRRAREDIWEIAARVMRPEQLQTLDFMIWDWRRQNPDVPMVALVRFGDFAASRGRSVVADVKTGSGFLAPVDSAKKAVDEARLFGERVFFISKRAPFLVGWEAEAVANELLAAPEVGEGLRSFSSLAASAEKLSGAVDRLPQDAGEVRAVVEEARGLVDAARPLAESAERITTGLRDTAEALTGTIGAADGLYARHERRTQALLPGERFSIERYVTAAERTSDAVRELNTLVGSADRLLGSEAWAQRVTEVNASLGAHMDTASRHSERLVDRAFWRAAALLGVFFGLLAAYRVFSLTLRARMDRSGGARRSGAS